jgi:hypothetical protein
MSTLLRIVINEQTSPVDVAVSVRMITIDSTAKEKPYASIIL